MTHGEREPRFLENSGRSLKDVDYGAFLSRVTTTRHVADVRGKAATEKPERVASRKLSSKDRSFKEEDIAPVTRSQKKTSLATQKKLEPLTVPRRDYSFAKDNEQRNISPTSRKKPTPATQTSPKRTRSFGLDGFWVGSSPKTSSKQPLLATQKPSAKPPANRTDSFDKEKGRKNISPGTPQRQSPLASQRASPSPLPTRSNSFEKDPSPKTSRKQSPLATPKPPRRAEGSGSQGDPRESALDSVFKEGQCMMAPSMSKVSKWLVESAGIDVVVADPWQRRDGRSPHDGGNAGVPTANHMSDGSLEEDHIIEEAGVLGAGHGSEEDIQSGQWAPPSHSTGVPLAAEGSLWESSGSQQWAPLSLGQAVRHGPTGAMPLAYQEQSGLSPPHHGQGRNWQGRPPHWQGKASQDSRQSPVREEWQVSARGERGICSEQLQQSFHEPMPDAFPCQPLGPGEWDEAGTEELGWSRMGCIKGRQLNPPGDGAGAPRADRRELLRCARSAPMHPAECGSPAPGCDVAELEPEGGAGEMWGREMTFGAGLASSRTRSLSPYAQPELLTFRGSLSQVAAPAGPELGGPGHQVLQGPVLEAAADAAMLNEGIDGFLEAGVSLLSLDYDRLPMAAQSDGVPFAVGSSVKHGHHPPPIVAQTSRAKYNENAYLSNTHHGIMLTEGSSVGPKSRPVPQRKRLSPRASAEAIHMAHPTARQLSPGGSVDAGMLMSSPPHSLSPDGSVGFSRMPPCSPARQLSPQGSADCRYTSPGPRQLSPHGSVQAADSASLWPHPSRIPTVEESPGRHLQHSHGRQGGSPSSTSPSGRQHSNTTEHAPCPYYFPEAGLGPLECCYSSAYLP